MHCRPYTTTVACLYGMALLLPCVPPPPHLKQQPSDMLPLLFSGLPACYVAYFTRTEWTGQDWTDWDWRDGPWPVGITYLPDETPLAVLCAKQPSSLFCVCVA